MIETNREIERLVHEQCMIEINKNTLISMLKDIGYEIDKNMIFNYANTANKISYLAKSMSYKDIETGLGYAQTSCPKGNLKQLQKIRLDYFVVTKGRIWEL